MKGLSNQVEKRELLVTERVDESKPGEYNTTK